MLSDVLRTIRLNSAVQFCFMPQGDWETDRAPRLGASGADSNAAIPFHIVVRGKCWVRIGAETTHLEEGDIVAFPFCTGHQLGAGQGGQLIVPTRDLPPLPWRDLPVLRYGDGEPDLRLLCGYLECSVINFQPLRAALPVMLHVKTRGQTVTGWLGAVIGQITAEVDRPRTGGQSMLERLTEIAFIEILRHYIISARLGPVGWLAALADPQLARCLALIHTEPQRDWSIQDLAAAAGMSRSSLAGKFDSVLQTSPIRYLRDWRLFLASVALANGGQPIIAIAEEAGYGTEAAFNRAFSRAFGLPPAAWRQRARDAGTA
ncbi:AraC family transcriptional regulator [Dongia mobilis]|uniref:AraC family transcriptional regulator n=1 Tax=Dongia mobilis TaxID=578943 RepID=UPI0024448A70|nr:AraC family transcriptional regulator [Dongia mobilis]